MPTASVFMSRAKSDVWGGSADIYGDRGREIMLFSDRDLNHGEKTLYVREGFLLSWEPLNPNQIALLLDLLEEEENN